MKGGVFDSSSNSLVAGKREEDMHENFTKTSKEQKNNNENKEKLLLRRQFSGPIMLHILMFFNIFRKLLRFSVH